LKVLIDEVRLMDDLVHIRYSTSDGNITSRVRLPIVGFNEAWIPLVIKEDLAQRKEMITSFNKISEAYIGKELEIVEEDV